jgi:hypothetical protein
VFAAWQEGNPNGDVAKREECFQSSRNKKVSRINRDGILDAQLPWPETGLTTTSFGVKVEPTFYEERF